MFLVRACFLLFILLLALPTRADSVDPGILFLEAFSSSCSSQGLFTQRTLSETQALKNIVETIKDDPACQDLSPLLNAVADVNEQLDFYYQGLENDELSALEDYADRLAAAIAVEESDLIKADLSYELAGVKLEILSTQYRDDASSRERRALATVNLAQYLDTVNKSYSDQMNCFERHKGLPVQLAGHLLSIAGGFFDPSLNLALTLSGRLMSTFFSFFPNLKFSRRIRDYRKTTMQTGLSCAMEALEQTVCDIQDRRARIRIAQQDRREGEVSKEWMGYELLTRDFVSVQTFLRRVEAGIRASSEQQGEQRANFREREGALEAAFERSFGKIGQARIELNAFEAGDVEAKRARLRTLVGDLNSEIFVYVGGSLGVLGQVIPGRSHARSTLWLRIGDPSPNVQNQLGELKSPSEIISELDSQSAGTLNDRDAVTNLDLAAIERHLLEIFAAGQKQLNVERRINLIPDAQGALAYWMIPSPSGYTPEEVSEMAVEYLEILELEWTDHSEWFASEESLQQALQLTRDTRARFERMIEIMRMPAQDFGEPESEEQSTEEVSQARLDLIAKTMALKEKDQVITDRLAQLVQIDLDNQLRNGLLMNEQSLDTLIRLGTEDFVEALSPGVSKRFERLKMDLDEAEPIARDNLAHFYKHYSDDIVDSIEHLQEQADLYQEGPLGVAHRKIAKFCILALNDPALGQEDDLVELCDGRVLGPDGDGYVTLGARNTPLVVSFNAERVLKMHPQDRLCSYRRHRNEVELYEDVLQNRPDRFYDELVRHLPDDSLDYPYAFSSLIRDPEVFLESSSQGRRVSISRAEAAGVSTPWYFDVEDQAWKERDI